MDIWFALVIGKQCLFASAATEEAGRKNGEKLWRCSVVTWLKLQFGLGGGLRRYMGEVWGEILDALTGLGNVWMDPLWDKNSTHRQKGGEKKKKKKSFAVKYIQKDKN